MNDLEEFFSHCDQDIQGAKDRIRTRLSRDDSAGRFSRWILENRGIAHDIWLEHEDARYMADVLGLDCLLQLIHHALLDDGDLSFVDLGVLGPKALFAWSGHVGYESHLREALSRNGLGSIAARKVVIGGSHQDPDRFVQEFEAHMAEQIRLKAEIEQMIADVR